MSGAVRRLFAAPATAPPPTVPHEEAQEPIAGALQAAYRYLDRRERTASEMRRWLRRGGFDGAVIDRTLAALSEHGSLDDQRFARLFTADKRELEHWGSERIRRTLSARGVDSQTIDEALTEPEHGELQPFQVELDRALELLRRRVPTPPQNRRERDRALGVLIRKGYEPELALDALAAYARGE